MKFVAALAFAFAALLSPLHSQEEPKSHARLLLAPDFAWRKQSGVWTTAASGVEATAKETLSEYAASTGFPLKGRWLSLRITINGDAARAGLWLAGLRDAKGDLVRLQLDAASGTITNGRGRTIATLPAGALEKPVELVLQFTTDTMRLLASGAQIAELPVVFEEGTVTPSLFVERGHATFADILLGCEPAKSTLPKRGTAPAKVGAAAGLAVDFTGAKMTPLRGDWQHYFGVHSETAPGPWKTVRQFDGPANGLPLKPQLASQRMDGPFNKAPVEMDLAWFRDYQKREALGLDRNLPIIIQNDLQALYVAPWQSMLGKIQQDQIWALLKLAYSANTGAENRLYFQWGDDINSRALGTSPDVRSLKVALRRGTSVARGANNPADATAYAENYFAPAVEAVRRASTDVFGDERRIPVLIGSCARVGLDANREWFRSVLDHVVTGDLAPTLKGKRVIDLVDYLTVSHPFADAPDTKALQSLWSTYGKQIKGLWITNEFGSIGRSPSHILTSIARFYEWVAANELDAQQTRLIWDFVGRKRASDDCVSLMTKLAETMSGPLKFGMEARDSHTLYRISADANRLLIIYIATPDRRAGKPTPAGELTIEVGEARAKKPWIARMLQNSIRGAVDEIVAVKTAATHLILTPNATTTGTWAVLVEMP